VRLGKPSPEEIDRYNRLLVDNIEVFMPKSLFIPDHFTIALWSFLWMKGLTIDNWKLI
jgi:hypothetical protein